MTVTACSLTVLDDALAAGLVWLYDTVQPAAALVEHFGAKLAIPDRVVRFLPVADAGRPVVVLEVNVVGARRPLPLISEDEMATAAAALSAHGIGISHHENHGLTATIALLAPAHASLRAAVTRYGLGCPHHGRSLVCDAPISAHGLACQWHPAGHRNAIWPTPQSASSAASTCWTPTRRTRPA